MPLVVFYEYLTWQYGNGIREYLHAWQNIHWFFWRVFSVPLLLRTFFSPFRRTSESYGRGFDPAVIAQTLLINVITRFVGALVRGVLLAVASLFQGVVFVIGCVLFLSFITAPVAIPLSALLGILVMFL